MLYPQELVPILDQQLKDSALEWACEEVNLGIDGMERMENEQRAREMHQSVFKVRPYAGETRVNMRDLNPQGEFLLRSARTGFELTHGEDSQISTRSFVSKV